MCEDETSYEKIRNVALQIARDSAQPTYFKTVAMPDTIKKWTDDHNKPKDKLGNDRPPPKIKWSYDHLAWWQGDAVTDPARRHAVTYASYQYVDDTVILSAADQCRFWALTHYVMKMAGHLAATTWD